MAEQLYVKYLDGKPVAYAYGEEWVEMALFMDDMEYPTEEEARAAWERIKRRRNLDTCTTDKPRSTENEGACRHTEACG